jgi:hypothetical protein
MKRSLTTKPGKAIPQELADIFGAPPLVGAERIEEYNKLLVAVAASVSPRDAIHWLYVKDFVDISWQIFRERRVEVAIIKTIQKEVILELLKATHDSTSQTVISLYRVFSAADEAQRWLTDPKVQKEVEAKLAARGYGQDEIMAKTHVRAASQIEPVQKRIESYERRRASVMREIERRDEAFARALRNAPLDVIDGEFSEAAE